ncbi:hypothetical protein IAT38_005014 [Cryptococcus sp. DSM 104549]
MPPSPGPGKIHSLPVKVLYSIDTSPHSYVTVLSSLQDVYVHFDAPKQGQLPRDYVPEGPMGSCLLKPVVRGICYASPECIPNTTLDFSVYNLNPVPQAPAPRAFPGNADHSAWSGRGFLSWALAEASSGSTLVKGRLVREYEFSSTHFAPEGGLEGLVAAAAAAGGRGGRGGGDDDGKGWGLEVGISLRQLNPEGKAEFKGRSEFEETLSRGTAGGTSGGANSGAAGDSPAVGQMSSPAVSQQGFGQKHGQLHLPPPAPQGNGMARTGSAMSQSNGSGGMRPQPMRQQSMASSRPGSSMDVDAPGSGSSLPPSSFPGHPSSSSSNLPSRPSSTNPQQSRHPLQQYRSEPPRPSSGLGGASSDSAGPAPPPAPGSMPNGPPPVPARNRQVTPPPPTRPRSPPPSTPSRKKLHALLRADGMMSPELARHLASNPVLRNLLKAVPSNSNALSALRNITGINPGEKKKGKEDNGEREEKEGSVEVTTPTPSSGVVKPPTTGSGKQIVNQQGGKEVGPGGGCCNCGTTVSSCWRVRKMKEGPPRKVCDDCGVYFNEHKRMRPPELWDTNKTPTAGPSTTQNHPPPAQATPTEHKRRTQPEVFDGPAAGLRSSPRLNRSSSDHSASQPPPHFAHGPAAGGSGSGHASVYESPRKRSRANRGVPPSPRMATRASARAGEHHGSDFGGEVFGFSPHSLFGTTPSDSGSLHGAGNAVAGGSGSGSRGGQGMNGGHGHGHGMASGHASGGGALPADQPTADTHVTEADFDISALLQSMEESGDNFDINSLFAGGAEGVGTGTPELNQEILDLLAGWEGQLVNADMDGVGGVEGGGGGGGGGA